LPASSGSSEAISLSGRSTTPMSAKVSAAIFGTRGFHRSPDVSGFLAE
jgi:hypothetical protein